ncbi:MAG: hypothetical protein IKJ65_05660 [Clostridia bacterium]|nr:hypothetical protein [Clostridia bacterium]
MTENIFAPGEGARAAGAPDAGRVNEPQDNEKADQRKAYFENLIRGEYKQAFDQRVQKIIDKRFRDMRILKEQAAKIKPVLDALSEKYGEADAEKLVRILKDEAPQFRSGLAERQKAAFAKAMKWREDAEQLRQMSPEFDLAGEMKNAAFTSLLKAGVDMKTAYRAMHQDEILNSAVKYAAEKARDQTMKEMRMHASRPEENGAGGRGGAKMAPLGVNSMTRAEREEIERRCARGEKVYLS